MLDWSPSDLLAVSLENDIYMWDNSKRKVDKFSSSCATSRSDDTILQLNEFTCVKWSDNGNFLALASSNNSIEIWDVTKAKPVQKMTDLDSPAYSMDWNSNVLTSGSEQV